MLHHTMELASPLVKESFGAFCLCNFIVALLLLLSFSHGTAAVRVYDEPKELACSDDDEEAEKHEKETTDQDEMDVITNGNKKDGGGEEDKEEVEDNEEFGRRAEEFIQRMIIKWKVEKQIQNSQLLINLSLGRGTSSVRLYDKSEEMAPNEDDEQPMKSEKPEKPVTATMYRDEKEVSINIKKDDNEEKEEKEEKEEEDDDEELRKRAEKFIQRMVEVLKVEKHIQRSQLLTN